jgi:hypothetical protein
MRRDANLLRVSPAGGRLTADQALSRAARGESMKRQVVRNCVVIAAVLFAGSAWAQPQAQAPSVHVGFSFFAAGKALQAGTYAVDFASNGNVVLTPDKGGDAVEVPQIKALSHRNVQKPELVFDRVGSVMFLSEVWLPGKGGCQVGTVEDSQERETVTGPKGTK